MQIQDNEDWSNGCWKFSFAITEINYILKYIKTENSCKWSKYYCFYCYVVVVFNQINVALVSIKDFFQKTNQNNLHFEW